MDSVNDHPSSTGNSRPRPFRAAVFRGLGGFIPPLLTVVVVIWLFGTVNVYVLKPVERGTNWLLAQYLAQNNSVYESDLPLRTPKSNVKDKLGNELIQVMIDGGTYVARPGYTAYVPANMYATVVEADERAGDTASDVYYRYVQLEFLNWYQVLPAFLALFILLLYLVGKILAGRLGSFVWGRIERVIHRVPIVRNIYSSAKQVTEFVFNHRELEFTRVVAVEYPRKNAWTLGFVTGESFADIRQAADEAILAVLIPTSPMPVTGFTTTVLKSETIDLNITVDQALEYIVSCGVVVPPHQLHSSLKGPSASGKLPPPPDPQPISEERESA